MKIMNISCSINVADANQLRALVTFAEALGGQVLTTEVNAPQQTIIEATTVTKSRAKRTPAVETPAPVEDNTVEEPATETAKEEPATKAESSIDLEHLRGRVGGLLKSTPALRSKIVEKLGELGASSVPTLDPSKYEAFNDFLDTL